MNVTDTALWESVASTLERVVAPALPPGAELDTVVQLQGLARYAATRPRADPLGRAERLSRTLLPHAVARDLPATLGEASRILIAAQDPECLPSLRRRADAVRLVLLDMLAEDAATAAPLLEGFAGHPAVDAEPRSRDLPDSQHKALTEWFCARIGAPVEIAACSTISGGHSRQMLRVAVTEGDSRREFVVRIEQGGTFGTDGTIEATLIQTLARAGIAVAPVRWIEPSGSALGQPFFVMDLVVGSSSVDDEVLSAFISSLHALHQLDPARVAGALGPPPSSASEAVMAQVEHWSRVHHRSVATPSPLLEEAAEWLHRHLEPTGPVCVVHGDPGPGNFLVDQGRIVALTDWEFGHYGDAAEDWAYLAIRGRKLKDPAAWHRRFAELVQVEYGPSVWRAWEAFNSFKGACANLTALQLFRDGITTTPNLLAIGTAVHYRFLQRLADLIGRDYQP